MYQCSYCTYSEKTPYTTDFTDLHKTCHTAGADLLFKSHVCVECESEYVDITVVLYSVDTNLYGHLVICAVFYNEDYVFNLIFINLQRTSAHLVRYIFNAGDRFLYSCCIV